MTAESRRSSLFPARSEATVQTPDGERKLVVWFHHTFDNDDEHFPNGESITYGSDPFGTPGSLSDYAALQSKFSAQLSAIGAGSTSGECTLWALANGAFGRHQAGLGFFPNLAFWSSSDQSDDQFNDDTTFCHGQGVFFFGEAATIPDTAHAPTLGLALYVDPDTNSLRYLREDGTVVDTSNLGGEVTLTNAGGHTLDAAQRRAKTQRYTTTATGTFVYPAPASNADAYERNILNKTSSAITISIGSGSTLSVAANTNVKAWFSTAGVEAI